MKIVQTENPEILVIDSLNNLIKNNSNKQILLLLSGGSWLPLYEKINPEIFNDNITISVLDERFSYDEKVNNFAQLKQTNFYREALEKKVKFINIEVVEDETLVNHSDRFEVALKEWKKQNQDGIIIATMGVGTDGHTAGIFSTFDNVNDKWVVGYEVDKLINEYTERVTTTPYFLINEVDFAVAFIAGENKKEVLQKVISNDGSVNDIPAKILQKMKNVEVVTDCKL